MQESNRDIIAYYRVSTKKQGESGLGLEGQKNAVLEFARKSEMKVLAEYTEVETGKRKDRPVLQQAISHAQRSKAVLVVAKLDRLARNVAFTSALMEAKVQFVACDAPHASSFTIHILAAVAEYEAEQISLRTKAALAAAKARGVKLGSARPGHWETREKQRQQGLAKAREKAAVVNHNAVKTEYADLFPVVKELRESGLSLQKIADELNHRGHSTRRAKKWNRMQIARLLKAMQSHAIGE